MAVGLNWGECDPTLARSFFWNPVRRPWSHQFQQTRRPRTRLLDPSLPLAPPLALPAPGVLPVTGERPQLIVGKGILQVAVVGVVEHGFDSLPVQGTRNKAEGHQMKPGRGRTRNRAESGNCHLVSARSPVSWVPAGQDGGSGMEGRGTGPSLCFLFPTMEGQGARPPTSPVVGGVGCGAIRAGCTMVQGQQCTQEAKRDEQPEKHRARVLSAPPLQQQPPPPAHPASPSGFFREFATLRLRAHESATHFRTTSPRMQWAMERKQRELGIYCLWSERVLKIVAVIATIIN